MDYYQDISLLGSNMSGTHYSQEDNNLENEQKQTGDDEQRRPETEQNDEEKIKKKYGGLLRKKHPLISKDHDRAFFDSADWALGKQGAEKSKGPLEELRPKLQPTPHQGVHLRRSAYAPADDNEDLTGDEHGDCSTLEDEQEKVQDGGNDGDDHPKGVPEVKDDLPEQK